MENTANRTVKIPTSYFEILQFINDNKELILKDLTLLFEILGKLDSLLNSVACMSDLRKDTSIMLQAIRLEQDALFREITHELTLERVMQMPKEKVLEDFFVYVKANSQAMEFVDRLSLNYTPGVRPAPRRVDAGHATETGSEERPEEFDKTTELHEINRVLQEIKSVVARRGRVEFFELVMDAESYSKTVLNAFHLALALRMKLVSLKMDSDVLLAMPYDCTNEELGHSVLEITPEQYEQLRRSMLEESQ